MTALDELPLIVLSGQGRDARPPTLTAAQELLGRHVSEIAAVWAALWIVVAVLMAWEAVLRPALARFRARATTAGER